MIRMTLSIYWGSRLQRCLLLLACMAIAACAAVPPEASSTFSKAPPAKYRWEGYNDKLVEARLGPHRYMIPANYFRDQMGPDFQGNFTLMVQWPDLQPLAPGKRSQQDMETFQKSIAISPRYVDRVPMAGRLEKAIRPHASENTLAYQDPSERLDMMDEQPQRFGLTPYYVSRERFLAYAKLREREDGHPYRARLEDQEDRYLVRDAQGRLTTVIKCASHLQPDGFTLQGNRLLRDDSPRVAICTHDFLIPQDKIALSLSYTRIFLEDWKRIEDRTRGLLKSTASTELTADHRKKAAWQN